MTTEQQAFVTTGYFHGEADRAWTTHHHTGQMTVSAYYRLDKVEPEDIIRPTACRPGPGPTAGCGSTSGPPLTAGWCVRSSRPRGGSTDYWPEDWSLIAPTNCLGDGCAGTR